MTGLNSVRTERNIFVMKSHAVMILLALAIETSGCGGVAAQRSGGPQTAPDYRNIILRDLRAGLGQTVSRSKPNDDGAAPAEQSRSVFLNARRLGRVEISEVSQTLHNTLGVVWFACIRSFPAAGRSTDYAVFLDDTRIVDARTSVVTDNCSKQPYFPLIDIPPPRSIGDPGGAGIRYQEKPLSTEGSHAR